MDVPQLYVLQLVPSRLKWERAGLVLRLDAAHPGALSASAPSSLLLTVETSEGAAGVHASILLRVPKWSTSPSAHINGAPVPAEHVQAGSYLSVRRMWSTGDAIRLSLPYNISTSRLPDRRDRFARLYAIKAGPVVLGCVGCSNTKLQARNWTSQVHTYLELRVSKLVEITNGHAIGGYEWMLLEDTGLVDDVDNLISFEAFLRPGCFISLNSSDAPAVFQQLRLSCLPAVATRAQRAAASFRRHDPLLPVAHGAFHSYEPLSMPGEPGRGGRREEGGVVGEILLISTAVFLSRWPLIGCEPWGGGESRVVCEILLCPFLLISSRMLF
ncbi:MAG: hypothetical protein SGPRY_011588 [Prymnesium sp.]